MKKSDKSYFGNYRLATLTDNKFEVLIIAGHASQEASATYSTFMMNNIMRYVTGDN